MRRKQHNHEKGTLSQTKSDFKCYQRNQGMKFEMSPIIYLRISGKKEMVNRKCLQWLLLTENMQLSCLIVTWGIARDLAHRQISVFFKRCRFVSYFCLLLPV